MLGKFPGTRGKRRWRARAPRPCGASDALREREASWSAERQFRFGCRTCAFDQLEKFLHPSMALSALSPCAAEEGGQDALMPRLTRVEHPGAFHRMMSRGNQGNPPAARLQRETTLRIAPSTEQLRMGSPKSVAPRKLFAVFSGKSAAIVFVFLCAAIGQNRAVSRGFFLRALCACARLGKGGIWLRLAALRSPRLREPSSQTKSPPKTLSNEGCYRRMKIEKTTKDWRKTHNQACSPSLRNVLLRKGNGRILRG